MLLLVLISALEALTCGQTSKVLPSVPMLSGRIVGGDSTTIKDVPYQVSVQSDKSHMCGGSIISSTRILTAAHCTNDLEASSLTVRAGSTCHDEGGTIIKVHSICQHPQYNPDTIENDVSVLRLALPLSFSDEIQPISLVQPRNLVKVDFPAIVSGWGEVKEGGFFSSHLRKVGVIKYSQKGCETAHKLIIADSMTCFGWPEGGRDVCKGDGGSPLAIGRTQIGIASWGTSCGSGEYPGVYTDLSKAIIRNHINFCEYSTYPV